MKLQSCMYIHMLHEYKCTILKATFIQVSIDVYVIFFFLNVVGYLNIVYTKNKLIDVLT